MRKEKISENKAYIIPNVLKSFEVLEYVSKKKEGASFPELLEAVKINKTTLFRILLTLLKSGYLRSSPERTLYFISRNILSLACSALDEANLPRESVDIILDAKNELNETVMLGSLLNRQCVLIAQESSNHEFNFLGRLGMTSPLHASAPGKAILANLPECEIAEILKSTTLEKFTRNTIVDRRALLSELECIRKKGYAADCAEVVEGINCVAAPIFDARGGIVAAIWITGPANRISEKDFARFGKYMRRKADLISSRLGYSEK